MRHSAPQTPFLLVGLAVATGLGAQSTIQVEPLECLPNQENVALYAYVQPEVGGTSVRLYFRRLHPEGDFYFVAMNPSGEGEYWTTFPRPDERQPEPLTDSWWKTLQGRHWLRSRDCADVPDSDLRACWTDWLDRQEHEPAEYYVAIHTADETPIARSETFLATVLDPPGDETAEAEPNRSVCSVMRLSTPEAGWAANLRIGETSEPQKGQPVFHWLCYGVVSRIDYRGVPRPDDVCRRCVVGELRPGSGPARAFQLASRRAAACDDSARWRPEQATPR